jgi:hypothetical protein
MLTGIDHFIVAVPSPDEAAIELESTLGLRAGPGGRHEEYGSFNRLLWLGDSYIELLGVADPSLAAGAWFGPRTLSVLAEAGAGYVGLALVVDDLVAQMAELHGQGSRLSQPEAGERARPDGRVVRWRVAVPVEADPEVGLPFLIEHDTGAAEWTPEERAQRAAEEHPLGGPARLARVELPVRDIPATTMRLHRDVGLAFRPSLAGGGARDANAGDQILRLMPAAAGALPKVVVRGGSTARRAVVVGCEWVVEPAG